MMTFAYDTLITQLSQLFWPIPRLSGVFLSMPLLSSSFIPPLLRAVFIFALAFVAAPFVPTHMSFFAFTPYHMLIVLMELLLGIALGFILQMVFQVFLIAGQIIAMQAGLGFATMIDPASRATIPLVSQFFLMMVSLLFLALNGHLAFLDTLITSFKSYPIGADYFNLADIGRVIEFSGWMIQESVLVALPAILSLLIVSLSFGVMARVAPQLNIFSIGFPITLLMGFIVLYYCLPGVNEQFKDALMHGMHVINRLVR